MTWESHPGSWLDDRPAKGRATGLIEKGKGSKSPLGRTLAQTSRGPTAADFSPAGWYVINVALIESSSDDHRHLNSYILRN